MSSTCSRLHHRALISFNVDATFLHLLKSAIFVSFMCSFFPENLHSELILSSLQLVLYRLAAEKRLPVWHHSEGYIFSGPFGIIWLILSQFEKRSPLKPVLGGAWTVLHQFITAHEQTKKTEHAIFFPLLCFLSPEDLNSEFILYSLQLVLCRVATVKGFPIYHQSAGYISSGHFGSLDSF